MSELKQAIERAIGALEYRIDFVSADIESGKHHPHIAEILKTALASDKEALRILRAYQPQEEL